MNAAYLCCGEINLINFALGKELTYGLLIRLVQLCVGAGNDGGCCCKRTDGWLYELVHSNAIYLTTVPGYKDTKWVVMARYSTLRPPCGRAV